MSRAANKQTKAFFVETHTHCEDEPQHSDCCGELLFQGQNKMKLQVAEVYE